MNIVYTGKQGSGMTSLMKGVIDYQRKPRNFIQRVFDKLFRRNKVLDISPEYDFSAFKERHNS